MSEVRTWTVRVTNKEKTIKNLFESMKKYKIDQQLYSATYQSQRIRWLGHIGTMSEHRYVKRSLLKGQRKEEKRR
jgi:hypothetical protein